MAARLFEYVVTIEGERHLLRSPLDYGELLEPLQLERLTNANVNGVNFSKPTNGYPRVWFRATQPNGKKKYLSRICSDTNLGNVRGALQGQRFVINNVECLITRVY